MQHTNDGSTGFYASKTGLWVILIFCLVIPGFILLSEGSRILTPDMRPLLAGVLGTAGAFTLVLLYAIFIDKRPYVKIMQSQGTIEIRGYAPIHIDDIARYFIETRREGKHRAKVDYMCFALKDYSFYKLTVGQKFAKATGMEPFSVRLSSFSARERNLFDQAVRQLFKADIERRLTENK